MFNQLCAMMPQSQVWTLFFAVNFILLCLVGYLEEVLIDYTRHKIIFNGLLAIVATAIFVFDLAFMLEAYGFKI
jgi:hypothetical protein